EQRNAAEAAEDEAQEIRDMVAEANRAEQATLDLAEAKKREAEAMRAAAAAGDIDKLGRQIEQQNRLAAAIEHETAAAQQSAAAAARLQTILDGTQREAIETANAFARGEIDAREFAQQLEILDREAKQLRTELAAV